ncbi:YlbF family regulator [Effusibacillus dendaii]|uniref:YlbF family regulator n=1 Tax=Effusibacillus dendaii TaxID=2743772 RepID=A0A7I8DA61_9BACL|nr:YlbF family regulator [Effusibacillus dendaii]BCJ86867.1 hypothetical protein skT53_18520 [Effusibacillus dendaii]
MKDISLASPVDHRTLILQKAEQLAALIQSTETFNRYQQAETKINRHADAQALLFVARAKRNAYSQTSLRLGYDHPASIKAKQEYDEVLQKIEQIPLIGEYQNSQADLNDLMQGVARTIINTLSSDVSTEIYEAGPSGAGCSGKCGSCRSH